jgi:hypothetical protein
MTVVGRGLWALDYGPWAFGDYGKFLVIALGSACELAYLVALAIELEYIDPRVADRLRADSLARFPVVRSVRLQPDQQRRQAGVPVRLKADTTYMWKVVQRS